MTNAGESDKKREEKQAFLFRPPLSLLSHSKVTIEHRRNPSPNCRHQNPHFGTKKVKPESDQVHVDGNRVYIRPASEVQWIALNKPKGVICTVSDELGRPTVVDAVPGGRSMKLVPVGRLDRDSCGLILLTNENSWVRYVVFCAWVALCVLTFIAYALVKAREERIHSALRIMLSCVFPHGYVLRCYGQDILFAHEG